MGSLAYRGTRVASPLTHLENVTSRELWCKHMEQQTDALLAKAMRRSICQGVGIGLRTPSIGKNCQPGQPPEVVQQDEPVRAAEQVSPGDQGVQLEQESQQQHAPIPEPSAQPSSSSHEELMQVSTTPRRHENSSPTLGYGCSDQQVVRARCS